MALPMPMPIFIAAASNLAWHYVVLYCCCCSCYSTCCSFCCYCCWLVLLMPSVNEPAAAGAGAIPSVSSVFAVWIRIIIYWYILLNSLAMSVTTLALSLLLLLRLRLFLLLCLPFAYTFAFSFAAASASASAQSEKQHFFAICQLILIATKSNSNNT